jgi:uncharacterized protein YajQ (UPF0234 family)
MPSFDIVSKVDAQTLDNAVNSAKRELETRYDLKGSGSVIELDKKNLKIDLTSANEMSLESVTNILLMRVVKQGLDAKSLDMSSEHYPSGNVMKKEIKVKQGLEKEMAKKIVKLIKDGGLKVQPAIMDDQVRVTSKKIDDLQQVIALLRRSDLEQPLQFVNMKS